MIKHFTTEDLVKELAKREGVNQLSCDTPDGDYVVRVWNRDKQNRTSRKEVFSSGPALILVIID